MSNTKEVLLTLEEEKFKQAWLEAEEEYDGTGDPAKAAAKQVGGNHYQLPIQPIDYIVKNSLGYREGNVVKYVTRHKNKNGIEDIKKAIHYLEMIVEDYKIAEEDGLKVKGFNE